MKWRDYCPLVLSLSLLATDASDVSSAALPSWVCIKLDAIFINGLESANAIPHDPSLDSGGAYSANGNVTRNITVAGYATEPYYLHIPTGYRPARAMPLLVVLHGAAGTHADAITAAQGFAR